MKKIIIFTYYARHFKKLLPLIRVLQKDERLAVYVVLMTQEEQLIAKENGIRYDMLDKYTKTPRNHDFDLGWGLGPLITAIDIIEPDLFIAIEVNYILRNAIRYCKQKKIHNVIIQHGLANKYSLQAFLPFEGECFLAWGEYTKNYLVENFVDEKKIIITGGINFDDTLKIKYDKDVISKYFRIDTNKKWIVFTTQTRGPGGCPSDDEIYWGISETAKAARNYSDCQLIFQVHPSQQIEEVQRILEDIEDTTAVVGKYINTEELIAASDGLITFFSTTAVDALILRKPIMLINLTEDKEFLPFVSQGAAIGAYERDEIAECYKKLVDTDITEIDMTDIINKTNYKNDGKALSRVLDKCYDLLK